MRVAKVLESFLERSDEWVVANKIEIKALNKMDAVKRGKFKVCISRKSLKLLCARLQYTPPPEEGIQRQTSPAADVQSLAISENAIRHLPIGNQDTSDGTTVPVSRNFDRFRDMCMNILQSNYMTHTGIRHPIVSRLLSTTLKRESPAADVLTVSTNRNVRRRLSIGNHDVVDRTCVPVSRIFQRFRDMPTNNVEPEYITHTCPKFNSTMLVKERFAENEGKELSWGQANYQ
nr:hypothetical protein [Tanacetum cinerariifolium]